MKTLALTTALATALLGVLVGLLGGGKTVYTLICLALIVTGWLELLVASRANLLPPSVSDFFKEVFDFGE